MITALNYTDYLYRPRRPEELDTAKGGGAVFNQAAHQVDIVRLLGGGRVNERARRDRLVGCERARPKVPMRRCSHSQNGAFASLIYGGYGAFRFGRIRGMGRRAGPDQAAHTRRKPQRFARRRARRRHFKDARNYGGAPISGPRRRQPRAPAFRHFIGELRACRPAPAAERRA